MPRLQKPDALNNHNGTLMNSLSMQANWPEALATVLECRYEFGAGQALAFGVPVRKHFRIRYNYFADGELHEGEFASEKAVPQGTLFPVRYNPEAAHEHRHADATAAAVNPRRAQFVVGIVGSVVLSLVWLLVMRGCGRP
jgi:hypothetical protein